VSVVLDDPRRVRDLRRACRRTGEVRRPRWWHWRHWRRTRQTASDGLAVRGVYRFGLTLLIACGGIAAHHSSGAQLLTLIALLLIQARIVQLRHCLDSDPALAVLAQFPLTDRSLVTYQTRRRWREICWPTLDALGFWTVAWSLAEGSVPWLWLPIVAITHAMLIEALVLLLVRVWPMSGGLLIGSVGVLVWATFNQEKYPAVWVITEPILQALAWMTPPGWLNQVAVHLPHDGRLGGLIVALGLLAAYGIRWSHARLLHTWELNPLWRELSGRPIHTWEQLDEENRPAQVPTAQQSATMSAAMSAAMEAPGTSTSGTMPADATPVTTSTAPSVLAALANARNRTSGQHLLALGWAGRCALARCDADDRWLADLLAPHGTGESAWRWALLLAALPAFCSLAELSPHWGLAVLAAILLVRRMNRRALLIGALMVSALMLPAFARIIGIILPCAAAVLLAVPLAGGMWNGIPLGSSVLGSMPRTWRRMMRIMLMTTGLRLLAGVPIMALVLFALAHGFDTIPAAIVAAGWVTVVVSVPWVSALRLIQRTPGGIDIELGRLRLTLVNVICLMLHLTAAGLLLAGSLQPVISGNLEAAGMLLIGISLGLSLVTSAVHLVLLRHAYLRRVDLIPSV